MSNISVNKSTQFKINSLDIVTKAGKIDIKSIFKELNLYDSIFTPVVNGKILIKDSTGLSGRLLFDGSEVLLIDISKDENSEIGNYKKAFRIYKQSDRKKDGTNSETFILHFASDEFVYSSQLKINQSFSGTYSDAIKIILQDYLKVSPTSIGGIYEQTYGIRQYVIPNLSPLQAIEWCAKRSVDVNQSPNYMFFENRTGFNFVTLSTLLTLPEMLDIKFIPKNLKETNPFLEMNSARAFEVVSQNDNYLKTITGVNAGNFQGFDPITKTIARKNITFGDVYSGMKHANETPNFSEIFDKTGKSITQAFDSKKSVSVFGAAKQFSNYIKNADPTSLSKIDPLDVIIFHRNAILNNLMVKRIKAVMPGNFQLTSGFNVNVDVPNQGIKSIGEDNSDLSLSGKYLIVASRHVIGFDKHETIIEVASTSSKNEFIPTSSVQQNYELGTW